MDTQYRVSRDIACLRSGKRTRRILVDGKWRAQIGLNKHVE